MIGFKKNSFKFSTCTVYRESGKNIVDYNIVVELGILSVVEECPAHIHLIAVTEKWVAEEGKF